MTINGVPRLVTMKKSETGRLGETDGGGIGKNGRDRVRGARGRGNG